MPEETTYADAGVDIEKGDDVSRMLYEAAKLTWANRHGRLGEVIVPHDDFSGVRAIDVSNLPDGTLMNIGFDGVGTKMELAERIGDHTTIAHDLLAMVCDDAVVRGAEPVLAGSILDVNSLGRDGRDFSEEIRQLAEGYVKAARLANVAVVNGEVAELGDRIGGHGPFNYNWGASVVWFANKDRMFTGSEVKEGDSIVAFRENGFRSNGLSLVRKVLTGKYGPSWHEHSFGGFNLAEGALRPSVIYSGAVANMLGSLVRYDDYENTEAPTWIWERPKAEIHGVVHVTGGGIPGKLGRVLKKSGLGAKLDNLFDPPRLMRHCQELSGISNHEAYKTWNMGQGMLVITPDPGAVIDLAEQRGIEAKVAGRVEKREGLFLVNRGSKNYGSTSVYALE